MSAPSGKPRFALRIQQWRSIVAPIVGTVFIGLCIFWAWGFREGIVSTFQQFTLFQILATIVILLISTALTTLVFTLLVRGKGYSFKYMDGYHVLNMSQAASLIPGGVWGFAGLAGALWNKGISKPDSVIIIFLNTAIMLTACAIVGVSGLSATIGVGYASLSMVPLIVILLGRTWLDQLRHRILPSSSSLPSTATIMQAMGLSILVWGLASACFTWLLVAARNTGSAGLPVWSIAGAYATGYLGGYIAIFAPSGLGVSEGILVILLGPYFGNATVLTVAISFRILQTLLNWCHILLTLMVSTRKTGNDQASSDQLQ